MPNRFDIFISRIETKARGIPSLPPESDEDRPARDERHARPGGGAKPSEAKERPERRDRHDA